MAAGRRPVPTIAGNSRDLDGSAPARLSARGLPPAVPDLDNGSMGWLVVESKGGTRSRGARVEIPPAGALLCGRSSQADLVLPETAVSRRHAMFFREEGRDWVRDAGSTNGTRVNGRPVEAPVALVEGDTIQIGVVDLRYREFVARPRTPTRPRPAATGGLLEDTPRWSDVTLIGRGGMGEVYRARDRDLAVRVAIKRLRRRENRSSDLLARLHAREAALGRTIEHPNVVRVLEEGVWQEDPLLLLEWVDGQDVSVRGPSLAPLDRLEVLRQTALGLDAAHRAGIVHADLKPANLLLCERADVSDRREENVDILEAADADDEPDTIEDEALQREIAERLGFPERPSFDPLPFVGRDAEIAYLRQIAEEVADGGRRWVLLFGERGVGRHRLVEEFRRYAPEWGIDVPVESPEEWGPPEDTFEGVWITPLPPFFPDDAELARAAERSRAAGEARELFLKPFLRGQAIRLVERICRDPASARAFVDAIDREASGHPAQLGAAIADSFDRGAWTIGGGGYVLDPRALRVDERAAAESLLERLRGEEKGVRDLLARLSPVAGAHDFEAIAAISGFDTGTLYYLVEHAERAGYLVRAEEDRALAIGNPIVRRTLEKGLDDRAWRKLVKRALPVLGARIAGGRASSELHVGAAELARREGRLVDAFRWAVRGALLARQRYDRVRFYEAVDLARECYRGAAEGSSRRALQDAGEQLLGPGGRGLDGLDRLRRLPVAIAVKITDFGIARRVESEDPDAEDGGAGSDEVPWGTPRYMSPEQARRKPLGTASDIFSLGVVVRELVEGGHPLGDAKGRAAARAILDGAALPPEGRGAPLDALLRRMLSPDPANRPTALEVADELQRAQIRTALSG